MNDFELSPEDDQLLLEKAEARRQEENLRYRQPAMRTSSPRDLDRAPTDSTSGRLLFSPMASMTPEQRRAEFIENLARGGPPTPRRSLESWLVIWLLGSAGLGVILRVLASRYGWPSSLSEIADSYTLLCVWLLAGLFFCVNGVMYCIASINERNPQHDHSTSPFLHAIGHFCLVASLFLAAKATYVTAWQLPFWWCLNGVERTAW